MKRAVTFAALAAATVALAGCADPYGTRSPVATSTAAGGVLGAIAGQAVGGDTESTAVGALAGMSAGMATGAVLEGQQRRPRY
jgi:hypothetical protein